MADQNAPQKKKLVLYPRLSREAVSAIAAATLKPMWERIEAEQELHPKIGDVMKDGTIYAGISPDTGRQMFAAPADAPLTMKFNEAAEYASTLDAHGHKDFRVPTKAELNVLFQNREKGALKGTFNLTGSFPAGWYWSSTPHLDYLGRCQRLSDGDQSNDGRSNGLSVRPVRS